MAIIRLTIEKDTFDKDELLHEISRIIGKVPEVISVRCCNCGAEIEDTSKPCKTCLKKSGAFSEE